MKHLPIFLLGLAVIAAVGAGCRRKCKNEPPRAKIVNYGTDKASVHIETSNGNTVNINNILSGTESEWAEYAAGDVEFTVSIQNVFPDKVLSVPMETCWEYEIVIDSANQVSSVPTEREFIK